MWRLVLLALGGLRRTPVRFALTTLGVTIACAALVAMVAFALGLQRQAEKPFRMLGLLNHIEVWTDEDEDAKGAPVLDDEAIARFGDLPGVAVAYPDIRVRGVKLTFGDKSVTASAMAVPRHAALLDTAARLLTEGDFFSPGDRPEVLLDESLVEELGFASPKDAVGKIVTLQASGLSPEEEKTFRFEERELAVAIVGVYRFPGMMPRRARRTVLLPVELMKDIPGVRFDPALDRLRAGRSARGAGYERAMVRVDDFADLDPVVRAIEGMGFKTRTLLNRLQEMRNFFLFMDVLLAAIGTVALVVAALGIINTLLMSVLERYQEIGIYKAIGASNGDLAVLFLTEAGIIGLAGGLAGLALGRAVAWGLEIAINAYAQSRGAPEHLDMFAFPLWLLAATVVFSLIVSIIAGLYPALRAARVDPIQALRRE